MKKLALGVMVAMSALATGNALAKGDGRPTIAVAEFRNRGSDDIAMLALRVKEQRRTGEPRSGPAEEYANETRELEPVAERVSYPGCVGGDTFR